MYQLPTAAGDGIDLSLLTASLAPPAKVTEPDEAWDFQTLFTQVASELQTEKDDAAANDEGGHSDGTTGISGDVGGGATDAAPSGSDRGGSTGDVQGRRGRGRTSDPSGGSSALPTYAKQPSAGGIMPKMGRRGSNTAAAR